MSANESVTFRTTITAATAPPRLRGLVITATLARGRMEFAIDLPDDPTAQETGFVRWTVGEFMDHIRRVTGIESTMVSAGFAKEGGQ